MKTVFDLFPRAREYGWKFAQVQRGTEVGTLVKVKKTFSPIVSESNGANFQSGASADGLIYDLLLYVKPNEMPTLNLDELKASCLIMAPDSRYFNITQTAVGKNQETGEVEHYELMLKLTTIAEEEEA